MWKLISCAPLILAAGSLTGCGGVEEGVGTDTATLIDFDIDKPPLAVSAKPAPERINLDFDYARPPVAFPATPICAKPTGLVAMKLSLNMVRLGWDDACGTGPLVYHVQSRESVIPNEPPVYRSHFACGNLGARPRVLVLNEPRALAGPYRVRTCPVAFVTTSCKGVTVHEATCSAFSDEVRAIPCSGKGCAVPPIGER